MITEHVRAKNCVVLVLRAKNDINGHARVLYVVTHSSEGVVACEKDTGTGISCLKNRCYDLASYNNLCSVERIELDVPVKEIKILLDQDKARQERAAVRRVEIV